MSVIFAFSPSWSHTRSLEMLRRGLPKAKVLLISGGVRGLPLFQQEQEQQQQQVTLALRLTSPNLSVCISTYLAICSSRPLFLFFLFFFFPAYKRPGMPVVPVKTGATGVGKTAIANGLARTLGISPKPCRVFCMQ